MKTKMTLAAIAATVTLVSTGASATSAPAMSPYIESTLQNVCHAATVDQVWALKRTLKSYRLDATDVANKVVCDGLPIAEFAAQHQAKAIANYFNQYSAQDTMLARN